MLYKKSYMSYFIPFHSTPSFTFAYYSFLQQHKQRQVYAYALGFLEGLGLKKGEKIAVWMTNELEHVVVNYAAALTGITTIEIDPKIGFDGVL